MCNSEVERRLARWGKPRGLWGCLACLLGLSLKDMLAHVGGDRSRTFHSVPRVWSCGDYKIIVHHDSTWDIWPHQILSEGGVWKDLVDINKQFKVLLITPNQYVHYHEEETQCTVQAGVIYLYCIHTKIIVLWKYVHLSLQNHKTFSITSYSMANIWSENEDYNIYMNFNVS